MPTYVAVEINTARTIIAKLCSQCPRYHFYSEVTKESATTIVDALNRDE